MPGSNHGWKTIARRARLSSLKIIHLFLEQVTTSCFTNLPSAAFLFARYMTGKGDQRILKAVPSNQLVLMRLGSSINNFNSRRLGIKTVRCQLGLRIGTIGLDVSDILKDEEKYEVRFHLNNWSEIRGPPQLS